MHEEISNPATTPKPSSPVLKATSWYRIAREKDRAGMAMGRWGLEAGSCHNFGLQGREVRFLCFPMASYAVKDVVVTRRLKSDCLQS